MPAVLGILFGFFALVAAGIVAAVGASVFLALLIPFLILLVFFRVAFALLRVTAAVVLVGILAVCLV
jgi:hypothetical protein